MTDYPNRSPAANDHQETEGQSTYQPADSGTEAQTSRPRVQPRRNQPKVPTRRTRYRSCPIEEFSGVSTLFFRRSSVSFIFRDTSKSPHGIAWAKLWGRMASGMASGEPNGIRLGRRSRPFWLIAVPRGCPKSPVRSGLLTLVSTLVFTIVGLIYFLHHLQNHP